MKKLPILTCIAALLAPMYGLAQSPELSKQFSTCIQNSGGVTQDMIECIDAEKQRQDIRLNKNYKALMLSLNTDRKAKLQEAQRAWIKFRDTNCSFYYDPDGGSMARISANECVMTMTANRAKEIQDLTQ